MRNKSQAEIDGEAAQARCNARKDDMAKGYLRKILEPALFHAMYPHERWRRYLPTEAWREKPETDE